MAKQIQLTEDEKQRLKDGLEKHSQKYLFGSKHAKKKGKPTNTK